MGVNKKLLKGKPQAKATKGRQSSTKYYYQPFKYWKRSFYTDVWYNSIYERVSTSDMISRSLLAGGGTGCLTNRFGLNFEPIREIFRGA